MAINFLSRLAALVGLSEDAGVSPTTDEVLTAAETRLMEVEALKAQIEAKNVELEQLRTLEASREQERVAAKAKAEEERLGRIEAEIQATVEKYSDHLGKAPLCALEALLRDVKPTAMAGNDAFASIERRILAFVDVLPSGGPAPSGGRTDVAEIDVEKVAAEAAGVLDVDADAIKDAEIHALMDELKCDYTRAWAEWNTRKAEKHEAE